MIDNLKPGAVEEIKGKIIEKTDIRTFSKFGKDGRVCTVVLQDDTGKVDITLWNDEVDAVAEGDTISIKNGWVKEWQGRLQVSTGRSGTIEKL